MADIPKVVIVTRTRNRPVLLRRCIQSVLDQTYADWLHVIVNDGGDQKPLEELLGNHEQAYSGRLKVVQCDHLGMPEAANSGIRESGSEYLVIHDDDDSWDPSFLAKAVSFLDQEGPHSRYQGVICKTLRILEKEEAKGDFVELERAPYVPLEEVSLFRTGYENPFPPIAFLYRRQVHDKIGNFDPEWDMVADLDFNYRFLQKFEIGVIDEPLAFYHWRDSSSNGQSTNTVTLQKKRHGRLLNELKNHYLRRASSAREAAQALAFQMSAYAVENQWMTTEIREKTNEARLYLESILKKAESLLLFSNESLWPLLEKGIIPKLDDIIPKLESLQAFDNESLWPLLEKGIIPKLESLQAFDNESLWPLLEKGIIPKLESLQAFDNESLWPLLEKGIIPKLESLQAFDNESLWPKMEALAHSISEIHNNLDGSWNKQVENQQRLENLLELVRAMREESLKQWQLGRIRIQWLDSAKSGKKDLAEE